MNKKLSLSVCVPLYKGSHILGLALESLARQSYLPHEVILGDDNPPECEDEIEETKAVVAEFEARLPIRYCKNPSNLGCGKNLQNLVSLVQGDIIFLLAQDDILSEGALSKTMAAFDLDPDVGVVARPYFWFMDSLDHPVRVAPPYDPMNDAVLSIMDSREAFLSVFATGSVGQISGLAYRKEWLTVPFHEDVFPTHIYPFAGIWRDHKCVYLKDYTVAVSILNSQTRSVSSIYANSPTETWLRMYRTVFADPKYALARKWGEEHITTNYMGLVQLKNYAKGGVLEREIGVLIRERPRNLLSPIFWFFVFGTVLTPRPILRRMVDWYKMRIHSRTLPKINFRPAIKNKKY